MKITYDKNIKLAIKINNYENSIEVQQILFDYDNYWCDIFKKFKNLPISDNKPLYIITNHYINVKELTYAKFKPKNCLSIIDYKLIRKHKLNKLIVNLNLKK